MMKERAKLYKPQTKRTKHVLGKRLGGSGGGIIPSSSGPGGVPKKLKADGAGAGDEDPKDGEDTHMKKTY